MFYRSIFFIALLATALALGGALAHAFELLNKIALPRDEYFIVQKAYAGWNKFAFILLVQLASMTALVIMSRGQPHIFWAVVAAIVCLVGAQAVFWIFTFPTNTATQNWTNIPENWDMLRMQWEYSHAVGAGFQVLAMCSLIVAALSRIIR